VKWFFSTEKLLTKREIKEIIMTASQNVVDQLTAQLGKVKTELLDKLASLEAQVAAGESPDFGPLTSAVQALDDIVPDAPPAEPETPAEPTEDATEVASDEATP
jgi:hypothetical protein